MSKLHLWITIVVISCLMMLLIISCDNSPTDSDEDTTVLSKYSGLVEEIAPPPYSSTSTLSKLLFFPAIMDSIWQHGEAPLLVTVFGDSSCQGPYALYRNMKDLDNYIDIINSTLEWKSDSLVELTSPVAIPEECQAVMGFATIDLDYYLPLSDNDSATKQFDAGFKLTDSDETILFFHTDVLNMGDQWDGFTESSLFWATRNLITDAITIRCIYYKGLDDEKALWAFEIKTIGTSNFQYKLTAFYNGSGVPDGIIDRIIGGGNNETKFILRYQDFSVSDTLTPNNDIAQMFTGDYSDGGADTTGFAQYIIDSNYFTCDDLPIGLLDNPMDEVNLINPWKP